MIKKLLARYCHKIARQHLVIGAMGNISIRERGEVWIKKRGVWMEKAKPSDFIKACPKNRNLASKEIYLHLGCYKARPDIKAVLHTHPFVVTAIGTVLQTSAIRILNCKVIKYYKPGSIRLAKAVSRAIRNTDCVIMSNHGLVVVGSSLKEAYNHTIDLENTASKLLHRTMSKFKR